MTPGPRTGNVARVVVVALALAASLASSLLVMVNVLIPVVLAMAGSATWLATRVARKMRTQVAQGSRVAISPAVAMIPLALAAAPNSAMQSIGLVIAVAGVAVLSRRGWSVTGPLIASFAATTVVFVIAKPDIRVVLFIGVVIVVARETDRRAVIESFVDGIGLYLIANVVGYFALGLRSPAQDQRIALATSSGFFNQRIIFPFTQSVVTPPIMAAVLLVGVVPLMLASRTRVWFRLAAIASAGVVLVGANYRVPLGLSVLVVAALVLVPQLLIRVAPALAVATLLSPFFYGVLAPAVGASVDVASQVVPSFARDQSELKTLSRRTYIWDATRDRQRQFGIDRQLVGYGPGGHMPSRVSEAYAYRLRSGFRNYLTAGSHSTALQQLIDGGWIGLALLLTSVGWTMRRLQAWAARSPFGLASIAMILTLAASGATESIMAPGVNPVGYSVLLVTAAVALVMRPNTHTGRRPSGDRSTTDLVVDRAAG